MHKSGPNKKKCVDFHRYGIYQAERFGGKYIYFCSQSLMHWVSPIIADGVVRGGLLCGPVLTYNPEDFLFSEVEKNSNYSDVQLVDFKFKLNSLPNISPSRVRSLSELLFITAAYLSDMNYEIVGHGKSTDQQSEISSYIQYIKTMECNPEEKHKYPIEKERELLDQIANADLHGARKTLNELLGSVFFSSGNDFEIIKSRILELVVLLSRAALKGGADIEQIFGLNFQYLNKIHSFTTVEDLSYWLATIMSRFIDLVFTLKSIKHTDAIYKAIHFISNNFVEKITLEDVASEIFLSPAYFSKIFKEQTGYNFSQYLNKLRIEKSKSLLRNSRIPLVDIAGMVGYEDQSYYSKVFKKITGNSPGKYRDTRGLIESDNSEIHE
jgi:two-component system response regulator YesN